MVCRTWHEGGGAQRWRVAAGCCQARNPRLLQSLRARVEKLGGRIVEQCEVKQIVTGAGKVTHLATTQGDFSADAYIVTAGAWSKVLLGEHALKIDIKPIRGQMLLFKFDTPPVPHIVLQGDVYLIPRRDGHLLLGSTREDVGFDKSTTDEARAMLLQRGVALLPSLRDMPVIRALGRVAAGLTREYSDHWSASASGKPVHQQRSFPLWRDHVTRERGNAAEYPEWNAAAIRCFALSLALPLIVAASLSAYNPRRKADVAQSVEQRTRNA